jgi:flagellin-like protein
MSIKKILNSKKAISPILATLLLIVIAVAAIVVTYAWITTYMGSATQQAGVLLNKANVSFNETTRVITIDVQNTGTSDTKIAAVYIGTSASSTVKQTSTTPSLDTPQSLGAGDILTIAVSGYSWTAGDTYYFRVVPNAGAPLTFTEQAPQ